MHLTNTPCIINLIKFCNCHPIALVMCICVRVKQLLNFNGAFYRWCPISENPDQYLAMSRTKINSLHPKPNATFTVPTWH